MRGPDIQQDPLFSTVSPESQAPKDHLLHWFVGFSERARAQLACLGHLLMENRNGLVVDAQVTQATGAAERGQELRHQGLCGCTALYQRDTACCTEHEQPFIVHRWTHHPPSGLCHQPTLSQADQGMLRLGRGHRRDTQEPPCGTKEAGLPVRTEPVRLQPGSPAQSGNGGMSMAWLQGFGVPGNRRIGPDWPISGQRAGVTVLHLLPAARKIPSVGLFSTAC